MTDAITVGRRKVPFSHPDKALFADPEITKRALAEHYEHVAEAMLPHIRDRPLALQAFPKGIDEGGFFLKSVPRHFPDWITTVTVPKKGGSLTQVVATEAATLVYLVGQNVVTPTPGSHAPTSRANPTASSSTSTHPPASASPTSAPPRATPARGCAMPAWPPSRW